jgi:biopolymer transport protein ExbB
MGSSDYLYMDDSGLPHPLTNAADWVEYTNEKNPGSQVTTDDFNGVRSTLAVIHTGGFIVGILLAFIIIGTTFSIERYWSIRKARGNGNPELFIKSVVDDLSAGNLDSALAKCDEQRGSIANILRSAIERFKEIENDPEFANEKKISEVQRAIDEAMNLETPLLEKNLVILSTIASISVLFGLLGTTLGMIRAFSALGESTGGIDAQALSIGISEALYNTAGGLIGALIAIMMYNFFTTKVDSFVYMIDEAILSVTQIFTGRIKKS